jgi:hypothetical protein
MIYLFGGQTGMENWKRQGQSPLNSLYFTTFSPLLNLGPLWG